MNRSELASVISIKPFNSEVVNVPEKSVNDSTVFFVLEELDNSQSFVIDRQSTEASSEEE